MTACRVAAAVAAGFLALAASSAGAGEPPHAQVQGASEALAGLPAPKQFVSHHEVTIGGRQVAFTATAGESYIFNDRGEPIATMFSYAFIKDSAEPGRPVLFVVPGGPGGATLAGVGLFGPWRVKMAHGDDGGLARSVPPFEIEDNPNSLLDVADLIFIDPVGTGYSRIVGSGKPDDFYGIDVDIDVAGQFVEQWLVKNNRWNSPHFLTGESYGGLRAAIYPRAFNGDVTSGMIRGVTFNGVIPIANTLGYPGYGDEGLGPVLAAATEFPSYAVAAWYHQTIDRKGRSLEAYHDEAYRFAVGPYAAALRKEAARTLTADERRQVVATLIAFTGLPASAFDKKLALDVDQFTKQLLSSRGLKIASYDSRVTSPLKGGGPDPVGDDAALAREFPIGLGGYRLVEHDKLAISMDRPFVSQDFRNVAMRWNTKRKPMALGGDNFKFAAQELESAMVLNDDLRVLNVAGYFDLVMPTAQARLAAEMAGLPAARTSVNFYKSGHMQVGDAATAKVADDVRDFIRRSSQR
jgi:carboxypeptidase C (cathepsin A)